MPPPFRQSSLENMLQRAYDAGQTVNARRSFAECSQLGAEASRLRAARDAALDDLNEAEAELTAAEQELAAKRRRRRKHKKISDIDSDSSPAPSGPYFPEVSGSEPTFG